MESGPFDAELLESWVDQLIEIGLVTGRSEVGKLARFNDDLIEIVSGTDGLSTLVYRHAVATIRRGLYQPGPAPARPSHYGSVDSRSASGRWERS